MMQKTGNQSFFMCVNPERCTMLSRRWTLELAARLQRLGEPTAALLVKWDFQIQRELSVEVRDGCIYVYSRHGDREFNLSKTKSKTKSLKAVASIVLELHEQFPGRKQRWQRAQLAEVASDVQETLLARLHDLGEYPWLRFTRPFRAVTRAASSADGLRNLLRKRLQDVQDLLQLGSDPVRGLAERIIQWAGINEDLMRELQRLNEYSYTSLLIKLLKQVHGKVTPASHGEDILYLLRRVRMIPTPNADRVKTRQALDGLIAALCAESLHTVGKPDQLVEQLLQDADFDESGRMRCLRDLRRAARQANMHGILVAATRQVMLLADNPVPKQPRSGETSPGQNSTTTPATPPTNDWATLQAHFSAHQQLAPDDVLRSLLAATLRKVAAGRVYGLPDVEYWLLVPDQYLMTAGIERVTFRYGSKPSELLVATAEVQLPFRLIPPQMPPVQVRGGALRLVLVAAIMLDALLTCQHRFVESTDKQQTKLWRWQQHRTGPIRIPRSRVPKSVNFGIGRKRVIAGGTTPLYVSPHLRHIGNRTPSPDARQGAAAHGITLPSGYTFVRGYVRGEGELRGPIEYTMADIVLATLDRLDRH